MMVEADPTPAQVIRELGNMSLIGISTTIRQAGVRGVRGKAGSCPLAIYVTRRTGKQTTVGDAYWMASEAGGASAGAVIVSEPLPPTCRSFVAAVDCGLLPDLVIE